MVFPGFNIHMQCHASPKTLAKEVPISARITSAKQTRPGKRHLRTALARYYYLNLEVRAAAGSLLDKLVAF